MRYCVSPFLWEHLGLPRISRQTSPMLWRLGGERVEPFFTVSL